MSEQPLPDDGDPRWATVHVNAESLEPVEVSERDLELLDEMGFSVKRCWIEPGAVRGEPVKADRDRLAVEVDRLKSGMRDRGFLVGRNPDGVDDSVDATLLVVTELAAEVERLREALAELVRLKNEKDRGVSPPDRLPDTARSAPMVTMVCLYCGHTPSPRSITLGTPCMGCGKVLILTPEESR